MKTDNRDYRVSFSGNTRTPSAPEGMTCLYSYDDAVEMAHRMAKFCKEVSIIIYEENESGGMTYKGYEVIKE